MTSILPILANDCFEPKNKLASHNAILEKLLDRLVSMFEATRRRKKSSPSFDDECRLTRRQVRKLERRFRKTRSSDDRKAWTSAQRLMQKKYASKAEQYWSKKIASQKTNPRDLWSSVNRLLGESKEPATTDLTTESFQAFFNKNVEDIRSDTADAPSPMYAHHRDAHSQSLTRSVLKKND